MKTWIALLFALAGVINLAPVIGVASAGHVEHLYGVTLSSPDLALLMRHRAILLAIVGCLLLAAAARHEWRTIAALAGFASMISYLALAAGEPAINVQLRRIAGVDVVGALALATGATLHWWRRGAPRRLPPEDYGGSPGSGIVGRPAFDDGCRPPWTPR